MKRPNILIFHTDEHRADSLSPYNKNMITPNIQSLADEGTVFMRNYCQSPVCMPSRSSTFSCRYPLEIGCLNNSIDPAFGFPQDVVTFPEIFAENGYATCSIGKHHTFQHDIWQKWINCNSSFGCVNHFGLKAPYRDEDYKVLHRKTALPLASAGIFHDNEGDCAKFCIENGMEFIQNCDKPWLLRLSIEWPHNPVLCPRPYHALYHSEQVQVKLHSKEDKETRSRMDKRIAAFQGYDLFTAEELDWIWRCYYGLCAYVDSQVGRMLAFLKEKDLYDNTIIVFFSDHGRMLGEWGGGEKDVFDKPSWQTPLIVSWKEHVPVGKIDDITENLDVGPTLLTLAGLEDKIPDTYRGMNLFSRKKRQWTLGAIKSEYLPDLPDTFRLAMTDKKYRIDVNFDIYGRRLSFEQYDGSLYDLENDPQESKNLFYDSRYTETVNRLLEKLYEEFNKMNVDPRLRDPEFFRFHRSWEDVCGQTIPKK